MLAAATCGVPIIGRRLMGQVGSDTRPETAGPATGRTRLMKAKVFEVTLHPLPSGKSPASALEEQLNYFLGQRPDVQVVSTHINTIVAPAEPNAMPSSEEASIIIFCTLFYTE